MKKPITIREIFAEVAKNLNANGVLPKVARKWTTASVQSIIYRGTDFPALYVEFEAVKKKHNYK